jgi:hypothetical protein
METKQKFDFSKLNKKTVGIILLCVVIVAVTAFAVWGGGKDTVSDTSASDVETNDDVALGTTEETADQGGASKGEDTKKDQTAVGKDEAAGSDEAGIIGHGDLCKVVKITVHPVLTRVA